MKKEQFEKDGKENNAKKSAIVKTSGERRGLRRGLSSLPRGTGDRKKINGKKSAKTAILKEKANLSALVTNPWI